MKNLIISIALLWGITSAQAQTTKEELAEFPETMQSDMDSLYWDWQSKNFITIDENCRMLPEGPKVSDSVYIDRLSRIPTIIEMPFNDIVKKHIEAYTGRLRNKVSFMLAAANFYMPMFEEALEAYDLPMELKYLPIIESALNPKALSRVKATGLWQFMLRTSKSYGLETNSLVEERFDPQKSTWAAARYLKDLFNIYKDWNLVLAAYNCGPGNVNKAIRRAGGSRAFWDIWPYLPRETRGYVPAFVGALYTLKYHKEHGIKPEAVGMPIAVDTFYINKQLHLKQVSELTGAPLDELKNLNPQYRHEIIPGHEREYILRIPYTYTNAFIEKEDSLYKHKTDIYFNPVTIKQIKDGGDGERIVYKVKSGDYLGKIAGKYRVSVAQIKKWNNLKSNDIRVGQKLIIYRGGNAPANTYSSSSTAKSTSSSSTPSGSKITYTVQKGDVLGRIAEKHGVSLSELMNWNKLTSNTIQIGQKLIIYTDDAPSSQPAGNSAASAKGYTNYTVKSGDSFYSIAKNYPGVSAQNIMDYNKLSSSSLRPGMTIKIPQF